MIAGFFGACLVFAAAAAETNDLSGLVPKGDDTNAAQQTLRSYLQLQEQLHNTLLTIERTRKEADVLAKANADAITARLEAIEQGLGSQQKQEASLLQNSNRVTLIAAGVFAGLGLLAMIFTAWFLLRAMNRLATAVAAFPGGHGVGEQQVTPFLSTDAHVINFCPVEQSGNRLLGVIDRLEKRVHELEHTSHLPLPLDQSAQHNGSKDIPKETDLLATDAGARVRGSLENVPIAPAPSDRVSVILGKGQALLSLDKSQEALACFEEALAMEPRNPEALVKKGTALERLKRLEEAIKCYDGAIAANGSMTLAYLYKGGVCNQLERFNEALDCYEQALRSQQSRAAN